MVALRRTLDAWVRDRPPSARATPIERLRGPDDVLHLATQYEVLLYGYFRSLGYAVITDVPTGRGQENIDLLVEGGGCRFYVEIAMIRGAESHRTRRAFEDHVLASINDVSDPDYIFDVTFARDDTSVRPTRRAIRHAVREHLRAVRAGDIPDDRRLSIANAEVRLVPRVPTYANIGTTVRPLSTEILSQAEGRLREKIDRFAPLKDTGIPYLVAMCDGDVGRGFGHALTEVLMGRRRGTRPFFAPGKNTRLSGVLKVEKFNRDDGVYLSLALWANPAATTPLPAGCLPDIARGVVKFDEYGELSVSWDGDPSAEIRLPRLEPRFS